MHWYTLAIAAAILLAGMSVLAVDEINLRVVAFLLRYGQGWPGRILIPVARLGIRIDGWKNRWRYSRRYVGVTPKQESAAKAVPIHLSFPEAAAMITAINPRNKFWIDEQITAWCDRRNAFYEVKPIGAPPAE